MVKIPTISAEELREAIPMERAIDAIEEAFREEDVEAPARARHETTSGDLLVMPAWNEEALGVKLVTVNQENPVRDLPLIHGMYVLFDAVTTAPRALIDAEELTRIRTAAVSAVATKYLAAASAHRLVVFGAGAQAGGHIEAMCAIRPIEEVTIVGRTQDNAEALAREVAVGWGLGARVGGPEAVGQADIVCTCTSARTPVFDGALLPDAVHVNAIGSYRPDARELDDDTMRRAAHVVVEARENALREAGDVVLALASGALDEGRILELGDLLATATAPAERTEVTVFKSVGHALEDLALARLAVDVATR